MLHVVGASLWLGAWAAICMFARNVVKHPDNEAVHRLYAVMRSLGPVVIGPSTLAVLVAGVALVARSPHAEFTDVWIVAGLVLYAAVTVVGMVGLSRASRRAREAVAAGDTAAAAAATRSWLMQAVVITGLLLAATVDMVLKP